MAGSLVCHQLSSRSLYAGMMKLPVCARDMGIYSGIFVSMLSLVAMRRLKAQKPPGIAVSVLLCVLMLPMILDGTLSYARLIDTDNAKRLYTGLFFGLAVPFFLVPAAHFDVNGSNDRPVLKNAAELIPVYVKVYCFANCSWMAVCLTLRQARYSLPACCFCWRGFHIPYSQGCSDLNANRYICCRFQACCLRWRFYTCSHRLCFIL